MNQIRLLTFACFKFVSQVSAVCIMCGDYIESGLEEPKYREGPLPNYNVLIIRTDSGLFGKSGIKYHRQNLNKITNIIMRKHLIVSLYCHFPPQIKRHLVSRFFTSPWSRCRPSARCRLLPSTRC